MLLLQMTLFWRGQRQHHSRLKLKETLLEPCSVKGCNLRHLVPTSMMAVFLINNVSLFESVNFHWPIRSFLTQSQGSYVSVTGDKIPYLRFEICFSTCNILLYKLVNVFFHKQKVEMICDCFMCTSNTKIIEVWVIPFKYLEFKSKQNDNFPLIIC